MLESYADQTNEYNAVNNILESQTSSNVIILNSLHKSVDYQWSRHI